MRMLIVQMEWRTKMIGVLAGNKQFAKIIIIYNKMLKIKFRLTKKLILLKIVKLFLLNL